MSRSPGLDLRAGALYPFTAIVGQQEMKLALILSVIDPQIGGVLIMGNRGTGKSTCVRALAELLPRIKSVKGCLYGCDPRNESEFCPDCQAGSGQRRLPSEPRGVPVVELPLGATEDRVCGSLDMERALNAGIKKFEPGLLARANRGFLYVDEVNLLEDHLVDLLLDVAASGRNVVEREGISLSHPSRFVLVGSGNPEEGELRPQLTDRFGLHVSVATVADLDARVEIIRRRARFERAPSEFRAQAEPEQVRLRRRIVSARRRLGDVRIDDRLLYRIAALCLRLRVDGHRGELAVMRAAKALAAFEGRRRVTEDDVRRVAVMALRHRLRREHHGEMDSGVRIQQAADQVLQEPQPGNGEPGAEQETPRRPVEDRIYSAVDTDVPHEIFAIARPNGTTKTSDASARIERRSPGLKSAARGRCIRIPAASGASAKIAVDATVRAAAAFQVERVPADRQTGGARLQIRAQDLRFKQFKPRDGILVIFVVDASGSMALNRIREAKGAIVRLTREAYWRRDRVALIGFGGSRAEVLLPPGRSAQGAHGCIDSLPVGGGTPVAAGICAALELARHARQSSRRQSLMVLLTDGRANVPLGNSSDVWEELARVCADVRAEGVSSAVIDTRRQHLARGEGEKLAALLDARHVFLPRPDADAVYSTVTELAEAARVSHRPFTKSSGGSS